MKTIKIIDLFNKIANGEEVPKKIKYSDIEYVFNNNNEYINEYGVDLLQHVSYTKYIMTHTVEIIEEDKEIEEINLEWFKQVDMFDPKSVELAIEMMAKQLNKTIKSVNELKKEGK